MCLRTVHIISAIELRLKFTARIKPNLALDQKLWILSKACLELIKTIENVFHTTKITPNIHEIIRVKTVVVAICQTTTSVIQRECAHMDTALISTVASSVSATSVSLWRKAAKPASVCSTFYRFIFSLVHSLALSVPLSLCVQWRRWAGV